MTEKPKYILHADEIAAGAMTFNHPLGGATSEVTMSLLARALGLKRVGVNIGRTPPGKEAFVYHRHHAEEEWVFIPEGRARSDIDGDIEEVSAGDFIAYPPGVAHNLVNTGATDLVCLMGSDRAAVEISDFPRHGKRMIGPRDGLFLIDADAARPFVPDLKPPKRP